MKLSIKIFILLMLPVSLFAQSKVALKKQANIVVNAIMASDYNTVVNYTYPKVIEMSGGKQKLVQLLTAGMNQMKAGGMSIKSAAVGEPGKFYKAGSEIHCLVPQSIRVATATSSIVGNSNLLAVSRDGGKNWTFLDLNKNTIQAIPKIFPNFNKDLKIPEPKTPGF
ncbi:hypothetical protein [Mucilaginibacter glaciei]|uniref:DUF4251 domain-containing protein n=1 Tax=Mucilaginibacter glaciei TaxID=2772109 RepID=A0A926NR21_9SPHI|nr:hypothetical protein [Mucilaginibacter glaciei]MBD1394441.1 hypothetical protein [Mucilaginibacter glaciei]